MFTPRRNQRSRGFKVKHALQLLFLLGVCIWLLYQVRRSHEKETTLSGSSDSVNGVVKLGRKDLRPQREEIPVVDARHKEDEGDEDGKNNEAKRSDDADNNIVEEAEHGQEADAEKENGETDAEEIKEGASREDRTGENEENATGKMEANENGSTDGVSSLNRFEDSTEIGDEESDGFKAGETGRKEEIGKEEENNVDDEQGKTRASDNREQENGTNEGDDKQENIEDPINSDDHVQDGSDEKVEEAREDHYVRDNVSSAVDHPTQLESKENSTESGSREANAVDRAQSQLVGDGTEDKRDEENGSSGTSEGDGGGTEDPPAGLAGESHQPPLEKDSSAAMDDGSGSTDSEYNGTTNPGLQLNSTESGNSDGDGSDSAKRQIDDPSYIEKPGAGADSSEGMKDQNGSKDENLTSAEIAASNGESGREDRDEEPKVKDDGNSEEDIRSSDKSALEDPGNETLLGTVPDGNQNAAQTESSPEYSTSRDDPDKSADSSIAEDGKDSGTRPDSPAEGSHVETENLVETFPDGNRSAAQTEASHGDGQDGETKSADSSVLQVDLETLPETAAEGNHSEN